MSAINQMLQSLDRRGAVDELDTALHSQVQIVPSRRAAQRPPLLAVAALIVAVAAWFFWHNTQQTPVLPVAPILRPAPAVSPAPPTVMEQPITIAAASPQQVAESLLPPASRLSLELSVPPTSEKPAVAQFSAEPQPRAAKLQSREVKSAMTGMPARGQPESGKLVKQINPQQESDNEFRKAVALLQLGRIAEANESFGATLRLNPNHEAARQARTGLLLEAKRPAEALALLREGLRLNPKQTGFAMVAARIEFEQGDVVAALATLHAGLPYAAGSAEYQAFFAALLQREQRHREAVEHYLAALQMAPQSGVWWMGLGISLQEENRGADALEAFRRAKASNTLNPALQAFVEQRLRQLGRS